jgi:uncharacterized membrane protein YfhO
LFLSIPFDRGWTAHVDGKDATLLQVNAGFMGLMLGPGNHSIQLDFRPQYLTAGVGISLTAVLIYAALFVRSRITKRTTPAP